MKVLIHHLIETGVEPKNILYISLDDYLLKDKLIVEILAQYRAIHKLSLNDKVFLFFDEVTYKNDYHQQLKNIYDN